MPKIVQVKKHAWVREYKCMCVCSVSHSNKLSPSCWFCVSICRFHSEVRAHVGEHGPSEVLADIIRRRVLPQPKHRAQGPQGLLLFFLLGSSFISCFVNKHGAFSDIYITLKNAHHWFICEFLTSCRSRNCAPWLQENLLASFFSVCQVVSFQAAKCE